MTKTKPTIMALVLLALNSCTVPFWLQQDQAPDSIPANILTTPNATPRFESQTRAGNAPEYEVLGKRYRTLSHNNHYQALGIASWYGTKFHGKKTANGETYDMFAMTAAHKTLPIPSYVKVTNLENKRFVILRINDRGPFHDNRIIDLSYTAAAKLNILKKGTGFVNVQSITPPKRGTHDAQPSKPIALKSHVHLQVGAFQHLKNAQNLQQQLKHKNLPASRIVTTPSPQGLIHKLHFGPILSVNKADHLTQRLRKMGYSVFHFISD